MGSYHSDFSLVVEVLDCFESLFFVEVDAASNSLDVVVDATRHRSALEEALLHEVLLAVEHETQVAAADLKTGSRGESDTFLWKKGRKWEKDERISRIVPLVGWFVESLQ